MSKIPEVLKISHYAVKNSLKSYVSYIGIYWSLIFSQLNSALQLYMKLLIMSDKDAK